MHPNALLELCAELIAAVNKLDAPADATVSAFFRQHKNLGQRERASLAETVYAMLRERLKFQNLAQSGSGPLPRRLAMLAWRGSDAFLRGALSPVEKQWLEQVQAIDPQSLAPKLRHNLPDWLAEPLLARLGEDEFWKLAAAMNEAAPLDLRVNTVLEKRDEVQQILEKKYGIAAQATPWSPIGLRLKEKPALNKNPLFLEGKIEVQDEGSQLLGFLVAPQRREMVVDFCAGAGGKTLLLGAMMQNQGRIYAFDVSEKRLNNLKPRLKRSGLSNLHPQLITNENDLKIKRLAGKIDRVLVDAPCSGLGTLRRNPDLKWRQMPSDIAELTQKQAAILLAASRLLKSGGRLVYATCSFLPEENQHIVETFLAAHPEFSLRDAGEILAGQNISVNTGKYLQLLPHLHGTDGFFAAVLEKS